MTRFQASTLTHLCCTLCCSLLLAACSPSPSAQGLDEDVEAGVQVLPEAAPINAQPDLNPTPSDTIPGGENAVRGLIEQAGLDEDLAAGLAVIDDAEGEKNKNVLTFSKLSLARADYGLLLDHLYPEKDPEVPLEPFVFPEKIQALEGKEIELLGYMIPTDYVERKVREFMLVRDTGACCFGGIPRPDEWALVSAQGEEGFEYHPYLPIVVKGVMTILAPGSDPDFPVVYTLSAVSVRRYY